MCEAPEAEPTRADQPIAGATSVRLTTHASQIPETHLYAVYDNHWSRFRVPELVRLERFMTTGRPFGSTDGDLNSTTGLKRKPDRSNPL